MGLVAAMAATWLIATQGDPGVLVHAACRGLVWGIANGLSVAFYIMYPKRLFARWGSFAVTGRGHASSAASCRLARCASRRAAHRASPRRCRTLDAAGRAGARGVIAVVGTFAAFALYLHGVSIVGSVQGSLLGAIEPVSATAFSALWLGTAFSGADWVGFVLMMAMIFLVTAEKPEAAAQRGANEAEGERV